MKSDQIHELASTGYFQGSPLHGHIIETHISWVVISGTYAFKIKKPVHFSFVDFSTIDLRKRYCNRELRLNRRWSSIYKNVYPVYRCQGRLTVGGGKGRIVDYAVVMDKVNEALKMDNLLAHNKVSVAQVRNLAGIIASIHDTSRVIKRPFSLPQFQALFNDIQQFSTGSSAGKNIDKAIKYSDSFLVAHAQRFRERIRSGYQREVHGDMHSGNIFLEKKPVIFDCIEFNDRYRQIDILYEIAFLAMDLDAYDHPKLSDGLIREYQNRIRCVENGEDLEILNYFKCLRANIRAKVHLMQKGKEHARMAKIYLEHMFTYAASKAA